MDNKMTRRIKKDALEREKAYNIIRAAICRALLDVVNGNIEVESDAVIEDWIAMLREHDSPYNEFLNTALAVVACLKYDVEMPSLNLKVTIDYV